MDENLNHIIENMPQYSAEQVASYLHVSPRTLREAVDGSSLGEKVGGTVRYSVSDVQKIRGLVHAKPSRPAARTRAETRGFLAAAKKLLPQGDWK